MAPSLDTNCLLRWLLQDNDIQFMIVEKHLSLSKSRLHVADLVFAEMVWVLTSVYKLDYPLIERLLRKVTEHPKINCNRGLLEHVLDNMNSSPKVSFTDTCLAFYASLSGTKLLTFDKTLAKKFPRLTQLAQ